MTSHTSLPCVYIDVIGDITQSPRSSHTSLPCVYIDVIGGITQSPRSSHTVYRVYT